MNRKMPVGTWAMGRVGEVFLGWGAWNGTDQGGGVGSCVRLESPTWGSSSLHQQNSRHWIEEPHFRGWDFTQGKEMASSGCSSPIGCSHFSVGAAAAALGAGLDRIGLQETLCSVGLTLSKYE